MLFMDRKRCGDPMKGGGRKYEGRVEVNGSDNNESRIDEMGQS